MKFKNGISPVVAIALLLVVSVVAVVSLQTWFDTYSSGIYGNVEIQSQSSTESVSIETVVGDQLYVKGDNISVKQVLIDGVECNISVNISGVGNVSLSDCLDSVTSKTPEISIVTDSKVISKKVYLAKINPSNSESQVGGISPVYTDTFISQWDTTKIGNTGFPYYINGSDNKTIALPLESDGEYDFIVYWGDGTNDSITQWNQIEVNHTYVDSGIYTLNIVGKIKGFNFGYSGDKKKLLEIQAWGPLNVGNNGNYFNDCYNFNFTGTDSLNLSGTTNLAGMFADATSFNGNINNWDVSQVTDMSYMFSQTFHEPITFNQDISGWNVSNVVNMAGMFRNDGNFNQNINNWDVSKVTDMSYMFSGTMFFKQDLNNWNVSNVENMRAMFFQTNFNNNISDWDVSNVIYMGLMFRGSGVFNQNISGWNVSSVIDMGDMFKYSSSFNQSLINWDVNQVTDCEDFNYLANDWTLPIPNFTSCTI